MNERPEQDMFAMFDSDDTASRVSALEDEWLESRPYPLCGQRKEEHTCTRKVEHAPGHYSLKTKHNWR